MSYQIAFPERDSPYQVRDIEEKDAEKTLQLSTLIGWEDTLEDWKAFISKKFAFCAVVNNEIIGTAVGIPFEGKARISNVIVHPAYRGKGIAKRLFSHLIKQLKTANIHNFELQASDMGAPLYRSSGFTSSYSVRSFMRNSSKEEKDGCYTASREDHEEIITMDADAFHASRAELLTDDFTSKDKKIVVDKSDDRIEGFVLISKKLSRVHIGPWIHQTKEGAERLLKRALSCIALLHPDKTITVLVINEIAAKILETLNFKESAVHTHMYSGETPAAISPSYYGIRSEALG